MTAALPDRDFFAGRFRSVLAENKLEMFAEKADMFYTLACMLTEANETVNLTAVTDVDGIIIKHFADSLRCARYIPEGARLADIGCGGGFPCLPLAIARPDISTVAIDSTAKKLSFVGNVAKELSLSLSTLAGRAEELSRTPECREKFDFVTARAVASLPVLAELCLPFVRVGGSFAAMKSDSTELAEARNAIFLCGGKPVTVDSTPLCDLPRTIIIVSKVTQTAAKYPRAFAQIKKKPL